MEKLDYVRSVHQRINAMMSVSIRSISSLSRDDLTIFEGDKEVESLMASHEEEMISECSHTSYLPVPPTTPALMFSFDNLKSITKAYILPNLEDYNIPYVREVGIRACIDSLSKHFKLEDYKLNPVQFWFLDVITDCLWQLQDEYQFPEIYQKTVLQWVIFCINVITDPRRNFSRKQFFQVFHEALAAAKEHVQTGCDVLPPPEDLFDLMDSEDEEEISFPSDDSSSFVQPTEHTASGSYLAVGLDENTEIFKLPRRPPVYYKHVESPKTVFEETVCEEDTTLNGTEESVLFYQPDPNIPERFLSSSSSYVSEPGEDDDIPMQHDKFFWKKSSPKDLKKSCSSDTSFKQHETENKNSETFNEIEKNDIKKEWTTYLEDREEYLNELEKKILINTCIISVIRKFIYDYFHETFQYSIVQLGLINAFTSIRQGVNKKWNVPKVIKEELKVPKPKKEKKKKKDKIKKKTKAKKDKKKPKKDKAKKKPKKEKKSKKEKKPAKKKLTKEEKAELERLKKRQKELEEQWRREEENRRLLFPLKDATNDDFFREIFDHWKKPKEKKSKGKGKKKK